MFGACALTLSYFSIRVQNSFLRGLFPASLPTPPRSIRDTKSYVAYLNVCRASVGRGMKTLALPEDVWEHVIFSEFKTWSEDIYGISYI
jgi:hypothetical protein